MLVSFMTANALVPQYQVINIHNIWLKIWSTMDTFKVNIPRI